MQLNTMCIIGKICNDPILTELDDGKKVCNVALVVPRPYKNSDGVNEKDIFSVGIWNKVAEYTSKHCKKGDIICIKGHLQCKDYKISIIPELISSFDPNPKKDTIEEEKDLKM